MCRSRRVVNDTMSVADVRSRLGKAVVQAGGIAPLATEWGTSFANIRDVMRGYRDPGKTILARLGLEKVVTYKDKEE